MRRKNTSNSNRPHFTWQERVVARTDLLPTYKVVLWRLALHHNLETERCNPAISTLAKGAGVSERTAKRAIAKGEELGLIAVERSSSGHHYDHNSYRILHDEGVSSQTPVEDDVEDEGVSSQTPVGGEIEDEGVSSQTLTGVTGGPSNNTKRTTWHTTCAHGERVAAGAAASGDLGPDGPPRRQGKKKGSHRAGNTSHSLGGSNGSAGDAVPHWQDLVLLRDTIWVRGHISNAKRRKAEEDAWTAALARGASPEAIIAGAKKWAAVFKKFNGGLNFLPILADWLNDNGWEKPPPKHKQANGSSRSSGRRRRSNGADRQKAIFERIAERKGARS